MNCSYKSCCYAFHFSLWHRRGFKWPFEVWNEPNLPGFWRDADKAEYFKLYRVTATAIKEINRNLKKVPLDFVTRHAYTAKPPRVTPRINGQSMDWCGARTDYFNMKSWRNWNPPAFLKMKNYSLQCNFAGSCFIGFRYNPILHNQ